MESLHIIRTLDIPAVELSFAFSRSSGAGGQNVNKVNTRAELRFDVAQSPSLAEGQRQLLLDKLAHRLTQGGVLIINSDRHRTQGRNREDCLERFTALLVDAFKPPPPKRKPTRPGRAAKRRRLDAKKRHSDKKTTRRRPTL
jgi:ribosome-associated protein